MKVLIRTERVGNMFSLEQLQKNTIILENIPLCRKGSCDVLLDIVSTFVE